MAVMRDRPYTGSSFLVSLGEGDGRAPAAGFAEVIFPPFVLDQARERRRAAARTADAPAGRAVVAGAEARRHRQPGSLQLVGRGAPKARATDAHRRRSQLLADDHETGGADLALRAGLSR